MSLLSSLATHMESYLVKEMGGLTETDDKSGEEMVEEVAMVASEETGVEEVWKPDQAGTK